MVAVPTVISVPQKIATTELFRDNEAPLLTVFLIVLKAWNSSIKVSADYVSAEAPRLGSHLLFHCVLTWWKWIHVQALWGHFYKGITLFLRAPPSCPNHLPKGSPPNTIMLRLSFQQMNLKEPQLFSL